MIISWNTTQACNINCRHCYRDAGEQRPDELTTAEGKRLLDEIAAAGFKIVILSGGEPLLRGDIFELISHARSSGLRPVLGTNGTLIDQETACRLKAAGLARAGISIDSCQREAHDWFRGSLGTWDSAMQGIQACREVGLPFQIHTTVMDWNQAEITAVTDLAIQLGAVAHHIFFLVPVGRGQTIEQFTLRTAEYEALLAEILDKQLTAPIEIKPTCAPQFMRVARQKGVNLRFSRGCLAGTSYCVILPQGDVQPCPYLPLKAGNVREIPFTKIWREAEIFHTLRTGDLGGRCGACEYTKICGGCRARAYYYSDGDFMSEEPWCTMG